MLSLTNIKIVKPFTWVGFWIAMMLSTTVTHAVESIDSGAEQASIAVVQDYLIALTMADVAGLKHTLSAELLDAKRHAIDNTSYADLLARMYAGASFSIDRTERSSEGGILVHTTLQLDSGHLMTSRFRVEQQVDGRYQIAEER